MTEATTDTGYEGDSPEEVTENDNPISPLANELILSIRSGDSIRIDKAWESFKAFVASDQFKAWESFKAFVASDQFDASDYDSDNDGNEDEELPDLKTDPAPGE